MFLITSSTDTCVPAYSTKKFTFVSTAVSVVLAVLAATASGFFGATFLGAVFFGAAFLAGAFFGASVTVSATSVTGVVFVVVFY